ncbi:MAG: transglutaminase-like domain-containing protein [Planctomycetota bacterium]
MMRTLSICMLMVAAAALIAGCSETDKKNLANDAGKQAANSAIDAATNQGSNDGNTGETAEKPPVRKYRFTYNTRIPAGDGTKELRIWVPLAMKDAGVQEVADEKIEVMPAGINHKVTTDKWGNRMIYVAVANPTEEIKISWSATISRWEDWGQGSLPDNDRWKQSDKLINLDDAKDMVGKLGLEGKDEGDKANVIYADVLDNMKYDKSGQAWDPATMTGWGGGSYKHATTVCEGNCTDFHARFMGIGRASGMSVRFTMGIPMKTDAKGTYNSYHCWAHWYNHKTNKWIPVDISEADKVAESDPDRAKWFNGHLCCNRLALSVGRDVTLEPKQKGDALNYFVFPYAEADGKSVKLAKDANWDFAYENVE